MSTVPKRLTDAYLIMKFHFVEADSLLSCSQKPICGPFHMWGIFEAVKNIISSYSWLITNNAKECRPSNVEREKKTT
jgi:hypothetical protein